ncbi:metallophosphoesterase [Prosthecobacter sp.]|uniref:metallophosphoesterase n=1 Tax=Prosthecobacter sp. TaxID=1965333 RepID=UPI0037830566
MATDLKILHFTDLHFQEKSREDIQRRVKAFNRHVAEEKLKPDLLLFTGDLAYHGTAEEFLAAEEVFLEPIRKTLQLSAKNVIVIPGNHDVDRNQVSAPISNECKSIKESRAAAEVMKKGKYAPRRLEAFNAFNKRRNPGEGSDAAFQSFEEGLFSTRILEINGVRVGIAALNSAWLCVDNDDKKRLYLTEYQVAKATNALASANFKIALCHHPFDWFNEDEELTLKDLKREFPLILTGHLHEPESYSIEDATGSTLCLLGRAFFDGKVKEELADGFQIIDINLSTGETQLTYYWYIRGRDAFDYDTKTGKHGKQSFRIAFKDPVRLSSAVYAQTLVLKQNSTRYEDLKNRLSIAQHRHEPILVTPRVCKMTLSSGSPSYENRSVDISTLKKGNSFIFADKDAGMSTLFIMIASSYDLESSQTSDGIAVLINFSQTDLQPNREALIQLIEKASDAALDFLFSSKVRLLADGFHSLETEWVEVIHTICNEFGWTYIIGLTKDLSLQAIYHQRWYKQCSFYGLRPWGPSRIRDFAIQMRSASDSNVDKITKMVSDALRYCDLPASPGIISLYLLGLPTVSDHTFSSLTFLSLLEQIETRRLTEGQSCEFDTSYHRKLILQQIAIECHRAMALYLDTSVVYGLIDEHYQQGGLRANAPDIVNGLLKTGFLIASTSQIAFSHYVYFDYFLAKAFSEGKINENSSFDSIPKLVSIAQSLSLFAGLKRENENLAITVLSVIEAELPNPKRCDLPELDEHIKILTERKGTAEEVMREDLSKEANRDELDAAYESDRRLDRERRTRFLDPSTHQTIDDISKRSEALRAFYTIFRNLERIDIDMKVLLLERILDYHIDTNFHLVEYYYRSRTDDALKAFLAYVVTLTGQDFLAAFLASGGIVQAVIKHINQTDNKLKKMLMILLLSDLRVKESYPLMTQFLESTQSFASIEICYAHLRRRLSSSDEKVVSNEEKDLFRLAHRLREEKIVGTTSHGEIKQSFDRVFRQVETSRWIFRNRTGENLE